MKTGKLMKENCSRDIVGIEINYFLSNMFNLVLLFAMLTRGRRVQYGNVVVSSRYQRAASFMQHLLASR